MLRAVTGPHCFSFLILTHAHLVFMYYQDQWIGAWFLRGLPWGGQGTGACPAPVPALWARQDTRPWCAQAWSTTIARAWCQDLWSAAPTVYREPGLCCSSSSWKWVRLSYRCQYHHKHSYVKICTKRVWKYRKRWLCEAALRRSGALSRMLEHPSLVC